ncbi:MAG: FtsW/RodA/SpoVE family cell cycle protein [Telluria sp.]
MSGQPGRHGFILALALLCALQAAALWRTPAMSYPGRIAVALKPGDSIALGRDELAAPLAERGHVLVQRTADGAWSIRSNVPARPVTVSRDGSDQRSGALPLERGMRFQVGAERLAVEEADAGSVMFTADGIQWRYDGATLYRNGAMQPSCPGAPLADRAVAWWNRIVPGAITMPRPMVFGGNLRCANRLGIAHVEPGAAALARKHGAIVLSSSSNVWVSSRPPARAMPLSSVSLAIQSGDVLWLGATRFAVERSGAVLVLAPSRHVALYTDRRNALPTSVDWTWQERSLWSLPSAILPAAFLLFAASALAAVFLRWRGHAGAPVAAVALLAAGLLALWCQHAGQPVGAGVSMALGWAALGVMVHALGERVHLATRAALLLLAIGLLAQLEQGLGMADLAWMRHFQKSCALLALGTAGGTLTLHWLRARPAHASLTRGRVEWMLIALAGLALAGLALQVLFGDETGVFDLQPVEFAKLALTALTAHCLAIGMERRPAAAEQGGRLRAWLRIAAPVLVFLVLLGFGLVQVDDFSPLILLTVWGTVMALASSFAVKNWAAAAGLAALGALAIAAIVMLREGAANDLARLGFYADRFQVWLDPAGHPHTGEQVLLGARAIADGAWTGADHALGLAALGQDGGAALHVPAVQDDFAPSFFLNRHGLAAALLLWIVQAAFVLGLFQLAARAWTRAGGARDFRLAWRGRFACFALCGGAAFVLGHFLLSWGTNLSIFPVMGQPMSFLSAGGSHLLFFICPLLTFSAISSFTTEESKENHHAGLRPASGAR